MTHQGTSESWTFWMVQASDVHIEHWNSYQRKTKRLFVSRLCLVVVWNDVCHIPAILHIWDATLTGFTGRTSFLGMQKHQSPKITELFWQNNNVAQIEVRYFPSTQNCHLASESSFRSTTLYLLYENTKQFKGICGTKLRQVISQHRSYVSSHLWKDSTWRRLGFLSEVTICGLPRRGFLRKIITHWTEINIQVWRDLRATY